MQPSRHITPEPGEQEYAFGMFRLLPQRHLLMRGTEVLHISSRALDILILLTERRGELVSHREIICHAWPETIVEMNNLKVHVAALRSILGDGKDGARYIATVSGRGYQFVAPVVARYGVLKDAEGSTAVQRHHNLPALRKRIVGRDEAVASIVAMLNSERFVSIVGHGGVGKTTTALVVADIACQQSQADACFIDCSALREDRLVPAALSAALGLAVFDGSIMTALMTRLRERSHLLVFDNCEHVLDGAAVLAEQIRSAAPGTMMLVTSREALCSPGEHVYRLAPLAHPSPGARLSAAQALNYPAIQLFVERATERRHDYQFSDADTPAVVEICHRLDGIALAIELAATRTEAFSVQEIAVGLSNGREGLNWARRGVQARHTTLAAALDWSYDFLPVLEQRLLRSLAVFTDTFTLDGALSLFREEYGEVMTAFANLVAKSLIFPNAGAARYHLPGTCRTYALHKLELAGDMADVQRRHAIYCRQAQETTARGMAALQANGLVKDICVSLPRTLNLTAS